MSEPEAAKAGVSQLSSKPVARYAVRSRNGHLGRQATLLCRHQRTRIQNAQTAYPSIPEFVAVRQGLHSDATSHVVVTLESTTYSSMSAAAGAPAAKTPPVKIWKHPGSLEELECYDSYEEDRWQAGKSKRWTFFNMNSGELPIKVEKPEHYYIIEGSCSIQQDNGEVTELHVGDFAIIPCGHIVFKVPQRVRMFFTDHQSSSS